MTEVNRKLEITLEKTVAEFYRYGQVTMMYLHCHVCSFGGGL